MLDCSIVANESIDYPINLELFTNLTWRKPIIMLTRVSLIGFSNRWILGRSGIFGLGRAFLQPPTQFL